LNPVPYAGGAGERGLGGGGRRGAEGTPEGGSRLFPFLYRKFVPEWKCVASTGDRRIRAWTPPAVPRAGEEPPGMAETNFNTPALAR
jgi:hypothetical protein